MIEFNQIFCEDFEEAGRHERNFELDDLEDFAPQLNEKYGAIGKRVRIVDYANYILDNIFCDNQDDLLKIAILLGTNMRVNTADEQARSVH